MCVKYPSMPAFIDTTKTDAFDTIGTLGKLLIALKKHTIYHVFKDACQ